MLTALIEQLVRHEDLTAEEAATAMQHVMDGSASPAALAGLLSTLAMKGERPAEHDESECSEAVGTRGRGVRYMRDRR